MDLHSRTWDVFRCHRDDALALGEAIRTVARNGDIRLARMVRNYALVAFPRHPALVRVSEELGPDYDEAFYSSLEDGSLQSATVVLGMIRKRVAFRSVIDVGSGSGAWLEAAHQHGARHLVGVDGGWLPANRAYPHASLVVADLNRAGCLVGAYDLAICLEVAEHLRPESSATLVASLCNCSQVVLFSAALTRQFGDGHINCHPQEFWIEHFARQGYACRDLFRPALWCDSRVEPWYRQNMFLFVGPDGPSAFDDVAAPVLLNVYQPPLLFPPVDHYVRLDHACAPPPRPEPIKG